ncbi:DUF6279 family lipoprotein [Maricurvus nonylphenolicus]|uniref:DUF6279 family lipoprotein n=1 Tax=Maricurvus nonylphenolicus TaxID=1008307 RepID=UPI0036F1E140
MTYYRTLSLALAILLCAGCSTRFAYNYLDWWLDWTIEDYVSLDKQQQASTAKAIDRLHQWHRHEQLPLYADYLDNLSQTLTSDQLSEEQLNQLLDQGFDLWTTLLNALLDDSATLLQSLSDKQVAELFSNIEKYQETEFAKKYADTDTEALKQRSLQNRHKFYKTWLGSITEEQETIIAHWHEQSQPFGPTALQQRRHWREEFATLLAQRQAQDFAPQLAELFHYPPERWVDSYREQVKHNQRINQQLILALHPTLSDKQKRHCQKRLQGYIKDFQILARQGLTDAEKKKEST